MRSFTSISEPLKSSCHSYGMVMDDIAANQFRPVHVMAERGGEQTGPIAAFAENLISLLDGGDASPVEMAGRDADLFFLRPPPSASRPGGLP